MLAEHLIFSTQSANKHRIWLNDLFPSILSRICRETPK